MDRNFSTQIVKCKCHTLSHLPCFVAALVCLQCLAPKPLTPQTDARKIEAPQTSCNLDTIFPAGFTERWKMDSLGMAEARRQYYVNFFTTSKRVKKALPFRNLPFNCLEQYLGKPNITRKGQVNLHYIYFMALSWIGKDQTSYEGITLEFEVYPKSGLALDYWIMIT